MASTEQRKIQIIADGKKVNSSLQEMQASSRLLYNQLRKLPQGSEEFVRKSKDLKKVNERINGVKQEIRGTDSAFTKLKSSVGALGLAMSAAFVAQKVFQFFNDSSKAAQNFEKSLSNLSSITGATAEDLEFYSEAAKEMGRTTTLSASQAVEAFKLIGSAKPELLGNKEALAGVTNEAVALAEAAGIELPVAAQSLAGALNQFKLPADEASRVINALAAGSKAGAAAIPEITEAVDKFGPIAQSFNVSLEESVGLVETLAESNIKGAEAGTKLRNVLNSMAAVEALPPMAIEQMEKYGVNIATVSDKTIPLNKRLAEFSKISDDATALTKVFGKENMVAGQIVLQNVDKFSKYTDAVTDTNVAYEQQAINTNNLDGDMKSLGSAVEAGQIAIGDFLNKALRPLVQGFTALILGLIEAPKFLKENWDLFAALGVALVTFNAANIAATASTIAHTTVEKGRAVATRASAIAQGLLNAVMTANPIGLVIKAVGLLVGGFIILYNRSETLRAGVSKLFDFFKSGLSGMGEAIKNPKQAFLDFVDFLKNIVINRIKAVGVAFGGLQKILDGNFAEGFKDIGNAYIQGLTGIEDGIGKMGSAIEKFKEKSKKGAEENLEEVKKVTEEKTDETTEVIEKGAIDQLKIKKDYSKKEVDEEKKKQEEIEKLIEQYNTSRQATEIAVKELRIAAIQDETERELAEIDFKHEQEIAKIQEQRKELLNNNAITKEQERAQLALFQEQEDLLEAERKAQKAEKLAEEREAEKAGEMAHLEEKQQMQLLKMEEGFLKVNTAEQSEYEARLQLEREFAAEKLRLLEKQGKLETSEAQELKNKILSIDKEQKEQEKQNEEDLKNFKAKMRSMGVDVLQDGLAMTADILGQDEDMRKKHGKKIKALQIANVTIDGIREVAAIWKNYNASPMNILVPGSGAILAAAQTGLAIARTGSAISQIRSQQFAEGGGTGKGKMIDMMYNAATGQYSWSGGKVKDVGTFAYGGNVNSASTGLIGEKGAEWVAPNWMMKSPAYADTIGWLESERQRKGMKAFATGGATAASVPSNPITSMRTPNVNQMQNEMMSLRKDFAKLANEISRWPRELRVVNSVVDQRNKMRQLNEIEDESRITRSA